jgi:hypothetical protein
VSLPIQPTDDADLTDVPLIRIRVIGPSPDDEDWLLGESIDGSRSGGFPRVSLGENYCGMRAHLLPIPGLCRKSRRRTCAVLDI